MAAALSAEEYLTRVRARLESDGFEIDASKGYSLWAHRRKFRPSRFGFEDASVAIQVLEGGSGAKELEQLGDRAIRTAIETKVKLPRGFGSFALVYPVAVIERASSELAEAARTRRKHWSLDEYRVLFELSRRGLTSNDERQIWGAAYFKAIREQALRIFAA